MQAFVHHPPLRKVPLEVQPPSFPHGFHPPRRCFSPPHPCLVGSSSMEAPVHSPLGCPLWGLFFLGLDTGPSLSLKFGPNTYFPGCVLGGGGGWGSRSRGEARPSPQGPGGRGWALTNLNSYSGPSLRLVLGAGQRGPKFYTPAGRGLSYQCWSQRATLWGSGGWGGERHRGRDIQKTGHGGEKQSQTQGKKEKRKRRREHKRDKEAKGVRTETQRQR